MFYHTKYFTLPYSILKNQIEHLPDEIAKFITKLGKDLDNTLSHIYKQLIFELFKKLDNWKKFKPIRGKIEDFFKLLKQGLNMREIHKYTDFVKNFVGYNIIFTHFFMFWP